MFLYLIIGNLQCSFIIYAKNYFYSTKPLPDKNLCFNECKFRGKFDELFFRGLGFCLSLLENNLGFQIVFII